MIVLLKHIHISKRELKKKVHLSQLKRKKVNFIKLRASTLSSFPWSPWQRKGKNALVVGDGFKNDEKGKERGKGKREQNGVLQRRFPAGGT